MFYGLPCPTSQILNFHMSSKSRDICHFYFNFLNVIIADIFGKDLGRDAAVNHLGGNLPGLGRVCRLWKHMVLGYWHANPFISPFLNRTVTPCRALSWVDVCSLCLCLEPLTCSTNKWTASCRPKVPRQRPKSVRPRCRAHNVAAQLKSFKLTWKLNICHVFHGFCTFLIFMWTSWAGHELLCRPLVKRYLLQKFPHHEVTSAMERLPEDVVWIQLL